MARPRRRIDQCFSTRNGGGLARQRGLGVERSWYRDALGPLGYRVVLLEYAGYGGRPGELSEHALVTDAAESLRLLADEFGHPLYVLGESLGRAWRRARCARATCPSRACSW